MIKNENLKYRRSRAVSVNSSSTLLRSRESSQDIPTWRTQFYFHGKEIGRGHFSKVYRATCINLNKEVAVKIIRRHRAGQDKIHTIKQEIKIMKDLANLGIRAVVPLFEVHENFIEVALVMEFAKGGSLFDVVRDFQGGLPEQYVKKVIKNLLSALAAIHKLNIVHLDIKADNILLRQQYPCADIALCDFGLATQLNSEKIYREIVGTPDYIAPEIINYDEISMYTDMWSVGVLTFYLLTSESPFMAESKEMTMFNVSKIHFIFPEDVFDSSMSLSRDFISRLIVKKPNLRMNALEANEHKWLKHVEENLNNQI